VPALDFRDTVHTGTCPLALLTHSKQLFQNTIRKPSLADDSRMAPALSVAGKRTLVIGGTSGIGQAIATEFAADGATVIASSRSESAVAGTAEHLREQGSETLVQPCDVTDRDSLVALRDAIVEAFGGLDVLVVSAGAIARDPIGEVEESAWRRVLDVQLDGVYRALAVFESALADGGAAVTISSMAARLAMPTLPAYSAAKGGVEALTRVAAADFGPAVRVNAIAPGYILTPQNADTYAEGTEKRAVIEDRTAAGRLGRPDEVVGAAAYLASDAASYTTGEVLTVDGGFANGTF
jgi:NAD(P)-dependent dehydrogenase (short-subunit alcohol dehydrogenase family)